MGEPNKFAKFAKRSGGRGFRPQFESSGPTFVPGAVSAGPQPGLITIAQPTDPQPPKKIVIRRPTKSTPSPSPPVEPKPLEAKLEEITVSADTEQSWEAEATPAVPEAKEEVPEEPTKVPSKPPAPHVVPIDDIELDDDRPHLNVVFIGHVDHGKSTLGSQLMIQTGNVDARVVEMLQKEADAHGRASWGVAYLNDIDEAERERGKTIEVAAQHFATDSHRFTLLDAPGHAGYVNYMIGGANQADVAVLVVSARRGDFQSGFTRGGQTQEHAVLAKTGGVKEIIIAVSKMDHETANWDQKIYDDITGQVTHFLRRLGFKNVSCLPCSGITGDNLVSKVPEAVCPWYDGPCLLEMLQDVNIEPNPEDLTRQLRIPVTEKLMDAGQTQISGRIETGIIRKNSKIISYPSRRVGTVTDLWASEKPVDVASVGESVRMLVRGWDEDDCHIGSVITTEDAPPIQVASAFSTQMSVFEVPRLISRSYTCVMHIHSATVEVELDGIMAKLDRKTKEVVQRRPRFAQKGQLIVAKWRLRDPVAMETFEDCEQLGRFVLRDAGDIVGFGIVRKIKPWE